MFSGTGGMGPASAVGNSGTSPALPVAELGIDRGFHKSGRITFKDPWGSGLILIGELDNQNYRGARTFDRDVLYRGPDGQVVDLFREGEEISTRLNINMWSLTGELDFTQGGTRFGMGSSLAGNSCRFGPRVQYFNYTEALYLNRTQGTDREAKVSYNMFGVGAFGALDLGSLMRVGGGLPTTIQPVIKVAGTVGRAKGMRYGSWEVLLQLAAADTAIFGGLCSGLAFEVGFAQWGLKETADDRYPYTPITHDGTDENTALTLRSYFANVNVLF